MLHLLSSMTSARKHHKNNITIVEGRPVTCQILCSKSWAHWDPFSQQGACYSECVLQFFLTGQGDTGWGEGVKVALVSLSVHPWSPSHDMLFPPRITKWLWTSGPSHLWKPSGSQPASHISLWLWPTLGRARLAYVSKEAIKLPFSKPVGEGMPQKARIKLSGLIWGHS